MKKIYVTFILLACVFVVSAQQDNAINTVFGSSEQVTYGGYGGPTASLHASGYAITGGKGGLLINRKYVIGLVGKGTKRGILVKEDESKDDQKKYLSYGLGGLFFEYFMNIKKPYHFSYGLDMMACLGAQTGNSKDKSGKRISSATSPFLVLEPYLSFNVNIVKFMMASFVVSYRHSFSDVKRRSDSVVLAKASDFSGYTVGLELKFGKF